MLREAGKSSSEQGYPWIQGLGFRVQDMIAYMKYKRNIDCWDYERAVSRFLYYGPRVNNRVSVL